MTDNQISWDETCSAKDNQSDMSDICAKDFLDSSFNEKSVIGKIPIFQEIAPNFHKFTKIVIFKV